MRRKWFETTEQLIKKGDSFISAIPNQLGINLCSVEGIEYEEQLPNKQLKALKIVFTPDELEQDLVSFSEAIEALKKGLRIARDGWNGKGMYLFLIGTDMTQQGIGGWTYTNGVNDNHELLPFIAMKTADDKAVPWLASQTDILSEDWEII